MAIEVKLKPGWLLRDVRRAAARAAEWEKQRGSLMVRHIIDGHEVLLPADAKLNPPSDDLGGCYD